MRSRRSKKPLVVAGIPAYDEEKTIPRVIVQVKPYVDRIIVCDDGSSDMTGEIAKELGADVVRHERNRGYGAAIGSLFKRARRVGADAFVTLDADAQHNPSDIARLVKPVLDGRADVVIGSRFLTAEGKERIPRYRRAGISGLTGLTKRASGINVTDAQSGFRAYSRRALELIVPTEEGMGVSTEILIKAAEKGLKIVEEPTMVAYKEARPTHNPLYHMLDVVASTLKFVSIRHPLIFYGVPGLLALLIGVAFGVWSLQLYTVQGEFAPGVVLISVLLLLVGLSAIFMGVTLFTLISVLRERSR
ncbi:MAG: glycosyltransferase family 2 protein [Candidatus Bathyarchaeia archaeon]